MCHLLSAGAVSLDLCALLPEVCCLDQGVSDRLLLSRKPLAGAEPGASKSQQASRCLLFTIVSLQGGSRVKYASDVVTVGHEPESKHEIFAFS